MNNRHITTGLETARTFLRCYPNLPAVSEVSVVGNGSLRIGIHLHLTEEGPMQMQRDIDRIVESFGSEDWRPLNGYTVRKSIEETVTIIIHLGDDIPVEVARKLRSIGWPAAPRLRSV